MKEDDAANLATCSAAEALGRNLYTSNIYNHFWKMAHSSNVPHHVIDSVTKMDTAFGHVLFDRIVDTFGIALFQGRMPDPDAFMAYLVGNALLHDAITDIHIKLQSTNDVNIKASEEYLTREAVRHSKVEAESSLTEEEKEAAGERHKENASLWINTQAELKDKRSAKLNWWLLCGRSEAGIDSG
jgi:hypothetical protein